MRHGAAAILIPLWLLSCSSSRHDPAPSAHPQTAGGEGEHEVTAPISKVPGWYVIRPARSHCPRCDEPTPDPAADDGYCCPNPDVADFKAAIPALSSTTDIVATSGDAGAGANARRKTYEFTPEVSGPHEARVKVARCTCSCAALTCFYSERLEVFDTDPLRHFRVGSDVDAGVALTIARLYSTGKLRGLGKERQSGVTHPVSERPSAVERQGNSYLLIFETAACRLALRVALEGKGSGSYLRIVEPSHGWCCS